MRAGKVTVGTEQTCIALARGRVSVVLVSGDASEGTKKKLMFKCEHYSVRCIDTGIDSSEIGRVIGKTYAPAAVAIMDAGFARTLISILEAE